MKYLGVIDSLGAGGAERSNTDFWFYAREHRVEVKIAVFDRREHGTEKEVIAGGFEVIYLEGKGVWNHARQLKLLIEAYRPDVVHSTLFKANLRVRLAKVLGARFMHVESLVNTTYDLARLNDPNVVRYKMEGYRLLDAVTMNLFTDRLHAITQQVRQHYRKKLGVSDDRITVIPRGRNFNPYHASAIDTRKALEREFDIPAGTILFLSVGRQEFQKGHVYMLQALAELRQSQRFTDFRWLLVGRQGHASKTIEDQVQKLDLGEHVILAGHRYDVEKILPAADAYVFPSLYEGLGVALLEAQAAALPILCSDIAVFHETTTEENALYFDPLNTEDFAEKLYRIATRPELRLSMGRASLQNFTARFQLERVHRDMLEYFLQFEG